MSPEKRNSLVTWVAKAEEDLLSAEKLATGDPSQFIGVICFHCQQCAEKYLKAFLIYHDFNFQKVHDLEVLLKNCQQFDNDFETLDYKNLTDFAVDYRYFQDEYTPDVEEMNYFLMLANRTKVLVLSKIKLDFSHGK